MVDLGINIAYEQQKAFDDMTCPAMDIAYSTPIIFPLPSSLVPLQRRSLTISIASCMPLASSIHPPRDNPPVNFLLVVFLVICRLALANFGHSVQYLVHM